MRRALLLVTGVCTALALFWLVEDRVYPLGRGGQPGPGLFPLLIGLWLLAASLIVAGETYWSHGLAGATVDWPDKVRLLRVLGIVAACLVFILLLKYLGDLGAGVLTLLLVLRVMGMQRWRYILLTAMVMAAATHWLFSWFLGVPLPRGTLFD
jgi:hypothetical protein